MNVYKIYEGSDGKATQALYDHLGTFGPVGIVAVNLFRASKCSARAKVYRGRGYRDAAYGRKEWSIKNLCQTLKENAEPLGIGYGWKIDPKQDLHKWVFYVDIPTGQVSFHTDRRGDGPDYAGDWDGALGLSAQRIVVWTQRIIGQAVPTETLGLTLP